MNNRDKIKVLLDYNNYINKNHSWGSVTKDTIRDYLKGSHWHKPVDVCMLDSEIENILSREYKMYTASLYGSVESAEHQRDCDLERLCYLLRKTKIQ